ncbi:MAG: hypothetical protein V7K42_08875 [Nostoc sp.]
MSTTCPVGEYVNLQEFLWLEVRLDADLRGDRIFPESVLFLIAVDFLTPMCFN